MNKFIKSMLAAILSFSPFWVRSQCARYEPADGQVLFIIGQDCNATGGTVYGSGYIDDAELGAFKPAGVTTYYSLTASPGAGLANHIDWGAGPLHAQQYIGNSLYTNAVICIGLFMTDGWGNTLNVPGGGYNAHLDALADWIKSIAPRPVYLRIGYEFDGQYWASPAAYRDAWIYIVDRFRSQNVTNCAYVWQAASGNGGTAHLLQWYPGDNYVDWLGYSHFEFSGNQNEGADIFTLARQKRKPVMIAEATPKGWHLNNSAEATAAWNGYFTRLFNKINNNIDVVKALCYINQDWDAQPLWAGQNWGNSRIQANGNGTIKANWINEISKPYWLHARPDLWSLLENSNAQQPFGGIAHPVPGTIEAEDFDEGCLGVSYYDDTGGNSGGSVYRYGYSVDMGSTADVSGGRDIGWVSTGEWLEYTVSIPSSALYHFTFRVSSPGAGNTFHLEQDGVNVSGSIPVPVTGNWTNYTNITVNNISLSAGIHVLRLYFDQAPTGFNLNYFDVESSILPVKFSSIEAKHITNGTVKVEWITTFEDQNKWYEIERSEDGILFSKVGVVYSSGNASGGEYFFEDHPDHAGVYYYRIKQVDEGGPYSYSPYITVSFHANEELHAYPNPFQDNLFISGIRIKKIEIQDMLGKSVLVKEANTHGAYFLLDLAGLKEGTYILSILNWEGKIRNQRIVKAP